ncbi:SCARECROW-LIKE PROTEIN 15 [Salix purpurea]|uniref:SCARECROW-LIKE PROTEIN 15 n=1 Tax=Salix purpurea TaxID=77065 RepID=A0A9Q0V1E0_SALPP|nr:SCARECROW-LIKE PROTEIN 15 [Salix purpurea]
MKVPVPSPQNPKPASCNSTINNSRNISFNPTHQNLCYEPTSVLDLRRSPSPARAGIAASAANPIEWDDHALQNLDWDSIMRELDFHDDSAPALIKNFPLFGPCSESQIQNHNLPELTASQQIDPTQFLHSDFSDMYINSIPTHNLTSLDLSHSFHNNIGNWNAGFDFIQDLIKAADCFDTNELQLAQVILERLNHRLQSPTGKPLQRAAFFFKEALQSLLATGSTRPQTNTVTPSWSNIIQTIKAYKAFFSISPIPMFTDFTTNQAILDSLSGNSVFLHVIDFDIGFGCHYASLMKELVDRADSCNNLTYPLLRITAVITEDTLIETKLIKERLSQFAHELKIRFHIEFVLFRTSEMPSFKAIKFVDGEETVVILSLTIFRRLGSTNNVTTFVNDFRRVSPSVVIVVDGEGWTESGTGSSFRRNFANCLEFYSMMFESLDAAAITGGDWARKIEIFLLKPKILAAVEGCGRRVASRWREVFLGAGMRPVQLSQFADFQAESLLGRVQVRDFYVAKRQAELVLCWQDRPLIATSAWKC